MLESVRVFASICAAHLPIAGPIYEFGALQVEGQEGFADMRTLFPGREYVGTDMRLGPGVDRVLDLHDLDLPDESIGSALLFETLEHVEYPRRAIAEVHRVMRQDAILLVSAPFAFRIHNYPHDYWRFTPQGIESLLQAFPTVTTAIVGETANPTSVLAVASKSPVPELQSAEFTKALDRQVKFWRGLVAAMKADQQSH